MNIAVAAERLVDGSANVMDSPVVVISDGRIVTVTDRAGFQAEPDMAVVESAGTMLPGFIEMHAHLSWDGRRKQSRDHATPEEMAFQTAASMQKALASGVTTLRDMGGLTGVQVAAREAQALGVTPGPRLVVAGSPITTTKGEMHNYGIEADTLDEVVAAVGAQAESGVDWIKIAASGGGTAGTDATQPQYTTETLRAAVVEAERHGLKVAAHCHGTEAIRSSVNAGVHSLEHCTWLATWHASDGEDMWDVDDSLIDAIVAKGIYVAPTHAFIHLNELRGREGPKIGTMRDPEGRYGILADMWRRGVQFVTGLDSGINNVYHSDFAWTPRLMVEAVGISPMDTIASATRISAECLGLDAEIGTVEAGKVADLVVVDGDPLMDIAALHDVRLVVADGRVVVRDGMMMEARS